MNFEWECELDDWGEVFVMADVERSYYSHEFGNETSFGVKLTVTIGDRDITPGLSQIDCDLLSEKAVRFYFGG